MKILWITNIMMPIIADQLGLKRNSFGGWLTGIYDYLTIDKTIELTIGFPARRKVKYTETKKFQLFFIFNAKERFYS